MSQGQPEATASIQIDDLNVKQLYTNFCRVTSTPEELVLDLGLNMSPMVEPGQSQKVTIEHRVVMSPYTAKRLASLLGATIARYEQAFGPLETDPRKRVGRAQ